MCNKGDTDVVATSLSQTVLSFVRYDGRTSNSVDDLISLEGFCAEKVLRRTSC